MTSRTVSNPEQASRLRDWEQKTPLLRRWFLRIGVEMRLILCFIAVLAGALAITCHAFATEAHDRLSSIMSEQARQMAQALSLTSERMLRMNDWDELQHRGGELIKNRNLLYVGFLDASAVPRAMSSQDPAFDASQVDFDSRALMQARSRTSPGFGEYLQVIAPVLSWTDVPAGERDAKPRPHLLGYVVVGVSQAREEAQMMRINYVVVGVACLILLCAVPIAHVLVHRLFQPIRQLDQVTQRITRGDMNARVAIDRPDVIGDLARSFDQMVSRVRQHQQELEQANHDLEQKVEHRTAELENANTRLSTEIAEKEEFLRTVSHDLNAPLRNIGGMVSLLLLKHQNELDEEIIHRLQRIKSNVEIESDLIAELLELSRIKTRRHGMERVEVAGIVQELTGVFESDLRERGVELIVQTPLPVLEAEPMRIRQVFQNLIDNAIKYMPPDGPVKQIRIGCQVRADEAEFYVEDTGIGIDPEDIDRIFYVFRRGRNSVARNVTGKGVGLASVKSIVETYNGRIWVTSRPGQGSTFRFTINGKFVPQCSHAEPVCSNQGIA